MENFPNLMREKVPQIQETQRAPIKRIPKRPMSRHIIIKRQNSKTKRGILKAPREKQEVTYKGVIQLIRLATGFSVEMLQARREWQGVFHAMKNKGLQPKLL